MARPLRTLVSLSQSSIAGPSSLRPLAPVLRQAQAQHQQVRTAFNISGWDRYLPSFRGLGLGKSDSELKPETSASTDIVDPEARESSNANAAAKGESGTSGENGETGNLFDDMAQDEDEKKVGKRRRRRGTDEWTEHRYSSAYHKVSHRKLNQLSRQIAGLPIDEAIVQMQFSEKRPSSWIKSTLALARDHAVDKKLNRDKLVVAETWVAKGRKISRLDIKGRGKYGIKHHPSAAFHVVLREGKTKAELNEERFQKDLRNVRSAGVVREDGVIRRKVVSGWTW